MVGRSSRMVLEVSLGGGPRGESPWEEVLEESP